MKLIRITEPVTELTVIFCHDLETKNPVFMFHLCRWSFLVLFDLFSSTDDTTQQCQASWIYSGLWIQCFHMYQKTTGVLDFKG